MSVWTTVFPLRELPVGGRKLYTSGRRAIAVFRLDQDELYAIDNLCPHEGYPLTQGALKGCTLTCSYHNFKFDLRTGDCLMGDERVGTWPVRITQGQVQLDLRPPDRTAMLPERWLSLNRGLADDRVGHVAREVVRLLDLGVEPVKIAAFGAAHDATYGKWGSSHGLPVMRDVLHWMERYPGLQAAHPLTQGMAQVARGAVSQPAYQLPQALP
ncbi:MAG: nitrite reductase/ring-hydroxylating ferredoxin subunit, partial [Kiritimatiellia bacterium]